MQDSRFIEAVGSAKLVADSIAQGKVPAIDDLAATVGGDVKATVDAAVAQATDATRLLAMVDVDALKQLLAYLEASVTADEEFAFSMPNGRIVFKRVAQEVSLCALVTGANGARLTLSLSGGRQLCGNPAERFANPTRERVLFADLAHGYSHFQARFKLDGPSATALSIEATTYFKIHDDWVRLRFAGNDPEALTLTLQFVIGVKGGVSAKLQAEIEGQVLLELEVKPTQVAVLLQDIKDIITAGSGGTNLGGRGEQHPGLRGGRG